MSNAEENKNLKSAASRGDNDCELVQGNQETFEKAVKLYEIYRDRIRHEDSLINHRTNWMLGVQVAAAYGIGALLTKSSPVVECISVRGFRLSAEIVMTAILILVALGTAVFAFHSIGDALQRVVKLHNHFENYTRGWLEENGLPDHLSKCFPRLTGGAIDLVRRPSRPFWPVKYLPLLLIVAWVIIGLAGVYLFWVKGGDPRCIIGVH